MPTSFLCAPARASRPNGRGPAGARALALAAVGFTILALPRPASAQLFPPTPDELPPPDEEVTGPVQIPDFTETTLLNGLRLLVVPDTTAGATVYTLLIPGGAAADPEGLEGVASAVAHGMQSASLAGDPRIQIGVGASDDALAVTVIDSTNTVPSAVRRMSRAILEPSLDSATLEQFRSQWSGQLEMASAQSDFVALTLLARSLYGDHPYGRSLDGASVEALTPEELRSWYERYVNPMEAVLAVSGPVAPDVVELELTDALASWTSSAERFAPPVTSRVGDPRWLLVHQPTASSATLHFGFLLPPGSDPDWTPLAVLDVVLGGTRESRLFNVEGPDGEGVVAGASTAAQRRVGPGLFHAGASVQPGRAAQVLYGILQGLDAASSAFYPSEEVERSRELLAESFAPQASSTEGIAALLAVNRVFGVADSTLTTYTQRVRDVVPQDLHDIATEHLDTARVAVVVVGDATLLYDDLAGMGPFELVDPSGAPLLFEDLEVPQESPALSASELPRVELAYDVRFDGQTIGEAHRALQPVEPAAGEPGAVPPPEAADALTFHSDATMGGQDIAQTVTFSAADFRPVSTSVRVAMQGQSITMDLTTEGDRLVGNISSSMGSEPLDAPLPEGTIVGDMLEVAAWILAERGPGAFRLSMSSPDTEEVQPVVVRVGEAEEVTVPAGTMRAVPVEIGGFNPQTIWISVEAPRVPVLIKPAGQPVSIELRTLPGVGER